jgi:hypothetical protein
MSFQKISDGIFPASVQITLTEDEYSLLLFLMGMAIAALDVPTMHHDAVRLVNSMNEGNPEFTPYGVPEKKS